MKKIDFNKKLSGLKSPKFLLNGFLIVIFAVIFTGIIVSKYFFFQTIAGTDNISKVMVVAPREEVSFNLVTGDKTPENGYQKAKIILNGVYVDGYGGGACQASTTLYNALILADLEILEVNPHSLPVSYVPLAFDAMVSEGYSDLRFKNNLEYPIYIKTWGDETRAYVQIYGQPLEEGLEIVRRAEFIGTIPHEGDTIVKDENKEYADQIT